jgi:hypothetical protein
MKNKSHVPSIIKTFMIVINSTVLLCYNLSLQQLPYILQARQGDKSQNDL